MNVFNIFRYATREVRKIPLCKEGVTQGTSASCNTQIVKRTILNRIQVWCSVGPLNSKHFFFMTHGNHRAIYNVHIYALCLTCYTPVYCASVDCWFLKHPIKDGFLEFRNWFIKPGKLNVRIYFRNLKCHFSKCLSLHREASNNFKSIII